MESKADAAVGEGGRFSEATKCRVGPTERHHKDVVAGRSEPKDGEAWRGADAPREEGLQGG